MTDLTRFKYVPPAGMFESTYECKQCGFTYDESIDAGDEENQQRSIHDCIQQEMEI